MTLVLIYETLFPLLSCLVQPRCDMFLVFLQLVMICLVDVPEWPSHFSGEVNVGLGHWECEGDVVLGEGEEGVIEAR